MYEGAIIHNLFHSIFNSKEDFSLVIVSLFLNIEIVKRSFISGSYELLDSSLPYLNLIVFSDVGVTK